MPIHILSDDVISRIAAGEVVERPSSVVKELVENSLDAGATYIHIEIVEGGKKRIQISDDGIGIPQNEVQLALMRHATSKLSAAEDLAAIRTLGFRGEALSSIAAVSHTTIVTRHRAEDVGTQVRVQGGQVVQDRSIGSPAGTGITVENLFYNTPARLKFMKSETTEKRNINAIVMNYAMAYPGVRFVLVHDGRELFRTSGSGQLADVVVKVYGLDAFRQMVEIGAQEQIPDFADVITVDGFVSQPDYHRKDRTRIVLFVNGRAVQDTSLTYAVTQAYHTLMAKGHHPYAVLMIVVPPDFVDVNVHPTKAEVRFQDTSIVFSAVQRAVREGVIGFAQAHRHSGFRSHMSDGSSWTSPYDTGYQMDLELPAEVDNVDFAKRDSNPENDSAPFSQGMGRPSMPRTLPPLRVVGQIGAAYIVTEGPAGMYLIDQHAAHTRILYQELKDLYQQHERIPHRQLEARTLDIAISEARLLETHQVTLESVGFVLEPFGGGTLLIRSIPALLVTGDPVEHVWSLIELLSERKDQPLRESLLIHIAGRAAVKTGQMLAIDDMRDLVRKLERCPEPHTSPTGKAAFIHMSADQLQREFMRSK